MTLQMVTCPLCCQPGFNTSDALCSALISASTRKLICPVCNEVLVGLDKLTIHLFGHNASIRNPGSSNLQNSTCQSKNSVTRNAREDAGSSIVGPVLYLQSDNGQLFALAPSSLVNQFGTVTINTQNYISHTSVSENTLVASQNAPSGVKHSEFSSCKDLLTSGDFAEPLDEATVSEPTFSNALDDNFPSDTPRIENALEPSKTPPQPAVDLAEPPRSLIPCGVCEMGFSNKAILAVHKQLMHKNSFPSEETENGATKSSEKCKKKPLNCNWCPATFNLKSSLTIHVKVTHPAQKESFERKEGEKVACPVCNKNFPKESTLNQHMKAIHGEKPWQCTVCSKSFTTKYFLRKHKRIHTGETPYECTVCHKVFTFQQSYHKHMLYHTDDKPYCCSHCGRLFKELSTLNNHERIHSGEKPFTCETCGKCFRQRVSYLVHRRIHTGAMPYKCTACNKSFRYKISQRTHKCPEHPPGVVVKTQSTLVDRLQAAINLEESGEGQMKVQQYDSNPSTSRSLESSTTLKKPPKACRTTVDNHQSSDNSCPFESPCNRQNCLSHAVLNRVNGASGTDTPSRFPSLFDFDEIQEASKTSHKSTDEADIFSMNLDSSPSECLGKLHISSECQPTGPSLTPKIPVIVPHPNLGFDNMEDLDLCNLLFDVS